MSFEYNFQCQAITLRGKQCRRQAVNGTFCHEHMRKRQQPQIQPQIQPFEQENEIEPGEKEEKYEIEPGQNEGVPDALINQYHDIEGVPNNIKKNYQGEKKDNEEYNNNSVNIEGLNDNSYTVQRIKLLNMYIKSSENRINVNNNHIKKLIENEQRGILGKHMIKIYRDEIEIESKKIVKYKTRIEMLKNNQYIKERIYSLMNNAL